MARREQRARADDARNECRSTVTGERRSLAAAALLRLAALGAALAALPIGAAAVSVASASPTGEVAQVRQVVLRFSADVAPLGDLRLPDPATVACTGTAVRGSGRWSDARTWLFDFRSPLPPGSRCTAALRADWKPLPAAGAVNGATSFAFTTGGPAVAAVSPRASGTIEEDQHFLFRLTGPAVPATVAANAWCEVQGLGERLPLAIVDGPAREAVLRERRLATPDDAARALLVRCPRPLPQDADVRVVWGKGIASAADPKVVTSVEQRWTFRVRPAFTAEFSCQREKADQPCVPLLPMTLSFSAPIARAAAERIRLVPQTAGASVLKPAFAKDEREPLVSTVAFPTPLAENAAFAIELPPDLRDDAGRPLANAATFPLRVRTAAAPPIAKFAAAPFGIVEWNGGDAALPVTLRHVQGDLRKGSGAAGQVRVRRIETDADIHAWIARLEKYHESTLTAKEAGRPEREWFETVEETDARGRLVRRKVERTVGTRELSLLDRDAGAKRLDLPRLEGGDPRPFEVVGIPMAEPGYHVVEIESRRLGEALLDKRAPLFVRTGVLVTNLGVHVKRGRENTVVWVTTLDRAKPVEAADVAVHDCRGRPLWSGRTDASGLAVVPRALDAGTNCTVEAGLFVTARKAGAANGRADLAFVFSGWQKGIEPWRFGLPTSNLSYGSQEAEVVAATVFDRTLLRAGETVSMKHVLRVETSRGVAPLPANRLPKAMKIVHAGSGDEIELPLAWPAGPRSAANAWTIPASAKLGLYTVSYRGAAANGEEATWSGGTFRVEQFRLPLVDARLAGPADRAKTVAPAAVAVDVRMGYFSGGAMAAAPLAASALLAPRAAGFAGFEDFAFEPPRERRAPTADDEPDADDVAGGEGGRLVADRVRLVTDANGAATFTVPGLPTLTRPSTLRAEVTYADPNGETQTASTAVELWPAGVVVGIRPASWTEVGRRMPVQAVALGLDGKPLAGQAIEIVGRAVQGFTVRKRLVGGFYGYDNRSETKDLGVLCKGTSDSRGLVACEVTAGQAGELELVATAKDAAGRTSSAGTSTTVVGEGQWFSQDNDDRIDVLPAKKSYAPGEVAELQVRMPFREATALVAVEREGVIATKLVTLRGREPTVKLTVEPAWGPNVYVSVLALRGRVRETPWYSFFTWGWKEPLAWWSSFRGDGRDVPPPTAMVDLAKPAFKLGVAAIRVGLEANRLDVQVSADKPAYQVREKAIATVRVTHAGKPLAGTEIAFAAVDEGLLALSGGNASWNLLEALFRERAWGVETATGQSEIIGRRHYGRKAVAAGGGGGGGATRELFDTLLVWKATVVLDANGEAKVEVPLNDSLTSFRLVAVADATSGERQLVGTGSTSVKVSQDLQVLAGLPPLVRDGDRFVAMLTLRNTTAKPMTVRATLNGVPTVPSGPGRPASAPPLAFPPQEVALAPGAAQEIAWPVDVPAEATAIAWEAAAEDTSGGPGGAKARDRLRVAQTVDAAVPVRVLQATLQQLDGSASLPVAAPADALASNGVPRGGLQVVVQPRLTGALPGVRRFFETYPFVCLEQKTSKAIGLGDRALWTGVAEALPTYLDADGLAGYFPPGASDGASGSDRLTAYVVAATHEAGFALPDASKARMLDGLAAFVTGRIERRIWSPRADLDVRKLAALEALSRHGRATPAMLGSIALAPNTWPTAAVIDWLRILKRVDGIPDRAARKAEAEQILRGRLTWAGTTLRFSTEESDFWWWLMESGDANASKLVLAVLDEPGWKDELPRLVVGALQRQKRGAWLTTTANLWGSLALDRFGAAFEREPVAGRTRVAAPVEALVADWAATPQGAATRVAWPPRAPASASSPATLQVRQEGTGKPWLTVQALAAIPLLAPIRAGYDVTRTVTPVQQKTPGRWTRGDVARVRLEIEAQGDMTWVVVADPVPGGATVLGSGLGRDSAIASRDAPASGAAAEALRRSASPVFVERTFAAYRAYYERLPRGRHVVEYTVRLNNPGRFALPPTRVEAMYAPETFGELPNAPMDVAP